MMIRLACRPSLGSWSVALLLLLASLLGAPDRSMAEGDGGPKSNIDAGWQPWQILETRTGQIIPFADWIKILEQQDIVYLGEEHHNHYHIKAALNVLEQLVADGIEPTIGMEMFGWDGQSALDAHVVTTTPATNEFLDQVRWTQNWGGAFDDYAPLVTFARDHHLLVRAMNPPKPLIRRVVKLGLEQAKLEPEWKTWGILQDEIVDDPAYRERIFDQLRRCHGGTDEHFKTMYDASMVRDEGMAKTLVAALDESRRDAGDRRRIIVSYTGGGHIQYNLPVPKRVARRMGGTVKQTTIYLMSFDQNKVDVQALMDDPIADYVWLTPVRESSPPKPCR